MTKKSYFFVAKIILTATIIWYFLGDISLSNLIGQIAAVGAIWYLLAIFIGLIQSFITAIRWVEVSKILSLQLSKGRAISYTFVGQFFNQILPSSIGGDAAKIWLASADGYSMGRVAATVLCDRFAGMAVVILIGLLSVVMISDSERVKFFSATNSFILIAICTQLLVLFFYLYGNRLAKRLANIKYIKPAGLLLRDIWLVLFSGFASLRIVFLSIAIQLMIIIAVYIFACGLGANLSFVSAIFLVPIVMLVAMMPVSFAGWGVREAAMVYGLGLAGVSEINALAISIMFGFTQVALGVPGAILWIMRRGGNGKATHH